MCRFLELMDEGQVAARPRFYAKGCILRLARENRFVGYHNTSVLLRSPQYGAFGQRFPSSYIRL